MNNAIDIPDKPPPPPAPVPVTEDAQFTATADQPLRTCPNCGAPAHGPFCYACGQSEKGMIRHLSEVLSDLADIVFNVDSRIFRSLGDLYFRPGYLTTEYLAGRRARYVTPFRLFFFLSIIAFFAIQMALPQISSNDFQFGEFDAINQAKTVDAVKSELEKARAVLAAGPESTGEKVKLALERASERADERILELNEHAKRVADATAAGLPAPKLEANSGVFITDGKAWDPQADPVAIAWLPAGMNAWLTRTAVHMRDNLESVKKDPQRLLTGWISVLPQTLFVVMPLFAVLLKFFYIFKRRLYMEHLLVALHSHSFIFMSILVLLLLAWLADLAASIGWLVDVIGVLSALAWIWLFLYLLVMQKRVYRQGWFMTVLKYCVIGYCYVIFLAFALAMSALASLAFT